MGNLTALEHASAGDGLCSGDGGSILFVSSPGVGVVVYPRVAGELVGARKAFGAAGKLAGVGFFARVSANVSRLVFETVEGLVAQGTLVRARQVGPVVVLVRLCVLQHGAHETDGTDW